MKLYGSVAVNLTSEESNQAPPYKEKGTSTLAQQYVTSSDYSVSNGASNVGQEEFCGGSILLILIRFRSPANVGPTQMVFSLIGTVLP